MMTKSYMLATSAAMDVHRFAARIGGRGHHIMTSSSATSHASTSHASTSHASTGHASTSHASTPLDEAALAHFAREGYVIVEGHLDAARITELKADIDAFEVVRDQPGTPPPLSWPSLGALISDPAIMHPIEQLLGPGFAYHHLHCARHDPGARGVDWHQDYEQIPQSNRSHRMVHVFYYLSGLNGTIGDLLLLPRSQNWIMGNGAASAFGAADLPGSIVIDQLSPGTAVIVHSALLHARRAKPGGEGRPRYFADCSYCQAGIRWPSTHSGFGGWRDNLHMARKLGLDRDGRYAHLFDEAHFFDAAEARHALHAVNSGSLTEHLLPASSRGVR
jgi:hypothetical protein